MDRTNLATRARGDELRAVLREIAAAEALDARGLDRILRRHPRPAGGLPSKRELLEAFRREPHAFAVSEAELAAKLRTCPTRTLSGITPVTVFTKPFPCPGRCIFCPSDVRMPKSYLAAEPGCQRAAANRFDPYLQAWNRLLAYRRMGHPTAKVELIVLGGTWSAYPEPYQLAFLTRCLDALSDFGAGRDRRDEARAPLPEFEAAGEGAGPRGYNAAVRGRLRAHHAGTLLSEVERGGWDALAAAQRRNETAASRCVGLAVETRPDCVSTAEVARLRRLGVTKVQIGIQSLSDAVLAANRRGHDVAATRRALALLRGAGFKLHAHWMANLLGSDPVADLRDFERLFEDPGIRPDELKIYPCSLIEGTALARHFASGAWQPYGEGELVDLLAACLARVPPWCRVTRMIRDIPSPEIRAGNRRTNLREVVERRLAAQGVPLAEIRAREIRGHRVAAGALALREHAYATAVGREHFLELTTAEGRIAAFLRLLLPRGRAPLAEIDASALVREVHVYGAAAELGERSAAKAQHAGLGRRLLDRAAAIARAAGHADLAVISAVGTRAYYRRLGFRDGPLYQHRRLPAGGERRAS